MIKPGLTFAGVGPGDPSLLTLAAVNAINKASIIAYPVARLSAKSIAREIVSEFLEGKKCLPIILPMIKDIEKLKIVWTDAANQLIAEAVKGQSIVFICLGDPSLYSTSAYLIHYIKQKEPSLLMKVIPGVSSFNAASALAKIPLSLQKEDLLVCPVPDHPKKLEKLLDDVIDFGKVLVLLKLGNNWPWVERILIKKSLIESTIFAQKIGFPDQILLKASDVRLEEPSYFSLLIVRKKIDYLLN